MRITPTRHLATALLAIGALTLSACSSSPGASTGSSTAAPDAMPVTASFYPLAYATSAIGGNHVVVSSLTKPGAEPHDIELTPKDIAGLGAAKLVVFEKGLQPAVDTAVAQQAPTTSFDVATDADLNLAAPSEDGHTDDHASADTHDAGAPRDPHFWLDPLRYAAVATAIAAKLSAIDPPHATEYTDNAAAFVARLKSVDTAYRTGLTNCRSTEIVTSHAAFGYLAERYGLTQVPIAGLDPEAEPTSARLTELADFVTAHKVGTIYAETLVEPKFAETIANSTGAKVAILDPIEGITSASAAQDYFGIMDANLTALRTGQGCS